MLGGYVLTPDSFPAVVTGWKAVLHPDGLEGRRKLRFPPGQSQRGR